MEAINIQVSRDPPSYEHLKVTLELYDVPSYDVTQLTLSRSTEQSPNKSGTSYMHVWYIRVDM